MKIGIFGGSFNPIHRGHISLAQGILRSGMIDEVWFMVSPHNPLKQQSDLMPDAERLALVQRAVEGKEGLRASDFEFRLPKPSYMYITLRRLQESYPDCEFTLLIGADNWLCFDRWKEYREILQRYPIIIYPREGYPIDQSTLPASVKYLSLPLYNISSTQIRQMIARGEDVSEFVP